MKTSRWITPAALPLVLFFCVRVPILLGLPYEALKGYGDLEHFFKLASIPGLPGIHYWIEYPPGFGFLNELLFSLSGGVEHVFVYLFVLLMLAGAAGSVVIFQRIEKQIQPQATTPGWQSLVYSAILAGLPYTWWYFDILAVFFLLIAFQALFLRGRVFSGGLALAAGMLVKLFPGLLLPALFKAMQPRRAAAAAGVALAVFAAPYLLLYAVSPEYSSASLASQLMRGSTETVWALLDGNLTTGNFGPLVERLDPAAAFSSTRSPAVVPPWLSLIIIGLVGIYLFWKMKLEAPRQIAAFTGLTMVLFFLWSPGWSPQWCLYLLPIIILTLDFPRSVLASAVFLLANLLEWPLLLSRGLFYTLPLTVGLRLVLLVYLGVEFYRASRYSDLPGNTGLTSQ